jgi:hypothetical protein
MPYETHSHLQFQFLRTSRNVNCGNMHTTELVYSQCLKRNSLKCIFRRAIGIEQIVESVVLYD